MFVYLRNGKTVKRISNVTLQQCYKPSVGTFVEDRVEPALWFKVLVIDSILVDVELRTVYINYERNEDSDKIHCCLPDELKCKLVVDFFRKQEQIFTESGYYDFDPTVDELFETAREIFLNFSPELIDKKGNNGTYEELLKMLHVFILPEIKFQKKERHSIEEVMHRIEEQHAKIEDLIQKKDNTKRNTENSLSKQRQTLLLTEKFSSSKYVSSLDDKFLTLFLQHLVKDIRHFNEVLLTCDKQVGSLRSSVAEQDLKKLQTAREERDEINKAIERAIIAREEIKNVISRKHVKKKFKKNRESMADFHELYVEISSRLDKVNVEIRELIIIKIKLSSVREAALLTLKEIDSDGISYGYNRKKGSFEIETDLFDPSHKPEEWATLGDKVKTYMQVKQVGFRAKYEKFCLQLKRKCQQLFDESKLFSISQNKGNTPVSPTTAEFINIIGNEAATRRSRTVSKPDRPFQNSMKRRTYSTRWSIGCIPKHECEAICKEVTNHIAETAYDLAVEIQGAKELTKNFHNKLYVLYEEHVSEELMPILCDLYEQSYKEQCDHLAEWLARFSCDMTMQCKTMASLFDGSPDTSEENSREVSSEFDETEVKVRQGASKTDTLGSLSNLSLNELYFHMNKQSEGMPQSFVGLLDMDYSEYSGLEAEENASGDVFGTVNDAAEVTKEGEPDVQSVSSIETEFVNIDLSNVNGVSWSPASMTAEQVQVNGNADVENDASDKTLPPDYNEVVLRKSGGERPPKYSSVINQKEQFYAAFDDFYKMVKEEDSTLTLFGKLRQMTRLNKYVEKQISQLRAECGHHAMTCTDDILDVIILLLSKLEAPWLLKLYAHLNLTIHLSPTFMQGNAHDYSLVNLSVAYQHLFEQQVLHASNMFV